MYKVEKTNKRIIRTILCLIGIMILLSMSIMAKTVNEEEVNNQKVMFYSQDDNIIEKQFADEFKMDIDEISELKNIEKEWKKVYKKLIITRKKHLELDEEAVTQLYKDGYKIDDIVKAEILAAISEYSVVEILEAKGISKNYSIQLEKNEDGEIVNRVIDHRDYLWSQVIKKLEINIFDVAVKLGMSKEDIQQMKKEGLSEYAIFNKAYEIDNNDEESLKSTTKESKQTSIKDHMDKEKLNVKAESINDKDTYIKSDAILIRALKITDEEINYCKSNSINTIIEIARAKHLAAKNDTTLTEIVEKKNKLNTWEEVEHTLGGDK